MFSNFELELDNWSLSGYYIFDALWVRKDGEWWYLICLFDVKINTIVAEDIFREHSRTKDRAFQTLAQLQGVLMYLSDKHVIELKFIEPLRVKNHMIPSIRPHSRTEDKSRMINRVKKLGYELETDKSDDEADAIGIMITYLDDKSLPVTHPIS